MARYRKKPVEVEAWQFNDTFQTAPEWVKDAVRDGTIYVVPDMYPSKEEDRTVHLFIKTLEGEMCAEPHDYIIQGVKGELYPCKPDIFEQTYEVVDEQTDDWSLAAEYDSYYGEPNGNEPVEVVE